MKSKLLALFTLILVATASTWAQRTDFGTLVTSNTSGTLNASISWTNGGTIMANNTPLNNGTTTSIPVPADGTIILYSTDGAELTSLTSTGGSLTSIDLSNCTTLTSLHCSNNKIAELNLTGCTSLSSFIGRGQEVQINMLFTETFFVSPISYKGPTGVTEKISMIGHIWGSYDYGEEVHISNSAAGANFYVNDASSIFYNNTNVSSGLGTILINRPGIPSVLSMTAKAGETININAKWTNGGVIWANAIQLTNESNTAIQMPSSGKITLYAAGGAELIELNCSGSQLISLDASNCTTLEKLDCSNNNLTELNVTGCTSLANLYADGQVIEMKVPSDDASFVNPISYRNKTGVEQVIIGTGNNRYAKGAEVAIDANATSIGFNSTNIGGSPFSGTINTKRTTPIIIGTLTMYSTSGTTDRISATWTNGKTILANGVQLPSGNVPIIDGKIILSTRDEAELTEVTYSYNPYVSGDLKSADLSNCTTLRSLRFSSSNIAELNLEGCTALTNLECSSNRLTKLNIGGCTSLESFSARGQIGVGPTMLLGENSFPNPIFYKNTAGVVEEIIIGSGNNSYANGDEVPANINTKSVDFKTATGDFSGRFSITQPAFTPVISMTAKVGTTFNFNTKWTNGGVIFVNNTRLTNESNTTIVVPADGKITLYSVEGAELTELNCPNNQLISLDASNCTTLKKLDCSNNNLAELDISGCTGIENLHVGEQVIEFEVLLGKTSFANPISYKNTTGEENVIIGSGNDSYAKSEEVPVNESITSLNFSSTNGTFYGTINFTHTDRVTLATMTSTRIGGTVSIGATSGGEGTIMANGISLAENSSVPVPADGTIIIYTTDGAELTELRIGLNQLTSLDVSNCTTLELLEASYNNITSLNISGCTNLRRLHISNQNIIVTVPTGETTFTNPILYQDISGIRNVIGAFGSQIPFDENAPSVKFSAFITEHPMMHEYSGTITIRGTTEITLVTMKTNARVGSVISFTMAYTSGTVAINGNTIGTNPTNTPVRSAIVPEDGKIVLTTTESATKLTGLSCWGIQLSSLVVNNGSGLTALRCHDNELTYLDISNCQDLTTFDASGQRITLPLTGIDSGTLTILNPISYNGSEVVNGITGATASLGNIVWTGLNTAFTSGSATYTFNAGNFSGTVTQPWQKGLYIWQGENSNWQDASNWAGGSIPNFENGEINTDIVETLALRGNSQEIPPLKGNTISTLILENTDNQLTINGNELNVKETLSINTGAKGIKVEAGKALKAKRINNTAGASALVIGAEANKPNGSLVLNPGSTPPVATVELLSKAQGAAGEDLDTERAWQYFGPPVAEFDASAMNAEIREYKGGRGVYWVAPENNLLKANTGYQISILDNNPIQFTGTLINSDQEITFETQSNWTSPKFWIASNPFTAAVNVSDIIFGNNTENVVYLFNTGSANDWGTSGDEQARGQYIAHAPETNGGLIPSMQGFMLQLTTPGEGKITLPYGYDNLKPNITMRSDRSTKDEKCYTEILLYSNNLLKDRAWLYTDANATSGFDNGYDGRKIFGDHNLACLYSPGTNAGEYFQVNAVDNINQTYLVFKAEKDVTDYTLTFNHHNLSNNYESITLLDLATGIETDITAEGSTYSFTAANNYNTEQRFQLRATTQTTQIGVADTTQDLLTAYQNDKVLTIKNNDEQHPSATIIIYNIAGAEVEQFSLAAQSIRQLSYNKGVYVVELVLPNGVRETEKVIIK